MEAEPQRGRTGDLIARACLLVVCAGVVVWLAGNLWSQRLIDRGVASIGSSEKQADAAQRVRAGSDDLQKARRFGSDPAIDVTEGATLLLTRTPTSQAASLASAATRAEPDNFAAWATLAASTRQDDPARSSQAARQARRLDPTFRVQSR